MKKTGMILVALLLALTFGVSCGTDTSETGAPPPDSEATAEAEEAPVENVIEYGETAAIDDNGYPLLTYIRFPQAGNPTDDAIFEWAASLYRDTMASLTALREEDPDADGEINTQFNSYLVADRYAGVAETGMTMLSNQAHPADVIRTFNIDTERGVLLENDDILDSAQYDGVLALLKQKILRAYPDTDELLDDMDAEWLARIVLGHDGIDVILPRSVYLPTYLGTLTFTLSYDELGSALILFSDSRTAEPESAWVPEPAPGDADGEPASEPERAVMSASDRPPAQNPAPAQTEPAPPPAPAAPVPPRSDIDPDKPMLALTFDDGPSKYTDHVLDLLEQYGGRATFCVVGNLVNSRKETVARTYNIGSEVIGHSWDHKDLTKLTAEQITAELADTAAVIEAAAGAPTRLYRPPYGAVSDSVKSVSRDLGYAIIYWSVDTLDWKTKNADAVYKAVMGQAADRAIVLCHDLHGTTAAAMDRVIPELIAKGYQLVTVSELIAASGKDFEAGRVYYDGK